MLLVIIATGCSRTVGSRHQSRNDVKPAQTEHKDAREPSKRKLPWAAYTVDELKLTIDVFADQSQLVRTASAGSVVLIRSHKPARTVLWTGVGQTIDKWRERQKTLGQARFESETSVRVCGTSARKQVAVIAEAPSASGLILAPDGGISGHVQADFPPQYTWRLGSPSAASRS